MSRLATSEVGHGERSGKAAPDRTLLGPQGPAPNLEGRLSAAGDHAACALRNASGRGGLRRSPALGCEEPGLLAPVSAVQRWPSLPRYPQRRHQRTRPRALRDLLCGLGPRTCATPSPILSPSTARLR